MYCLTMPLVSGSCEASQGEPAACASAVAPYIVNMDCQREIDAGLGDLRDMIDGWYGRTSIRAAIVTPSRPMFGAQQPSPGGRIVRTIGIVRAKAKIGLQNLAYNIRRLVTLERMAAA